MTESNGKISIPVGQALQALEVLQQWGAASFPAKQAFQIGKLSARLRLHPDVIAADQARMAAFKKFGAEVEGRIKIPPQQLKQFSDEYSPVANSPCEIEAQRLPISILEHAPNMTPDEMTMLEPFLEKE